MIDRFPKPLLFIRHGETDWNREQRFQGASDVTLNQAGREQARKLALHLARTSHAAELTALVTSPLQRSVETANLIGSGLGFDPRALRVEPAFRELSFGRWEGLTSIEVKERFYAERKSRKSGAWHFAPSGGESMESRKTEVATGIAMLDPGSIVVSHSGIMRIVLHLLGGVSEDDAARTVIGHLDAFRWNGTHLCRLPGDPGEESGTGGR